MSTVVRSAKQTKKTDPRSAIIKTMAQLFDGKNKRFLIASLVLHLVVILLLVSSWTNNEKIKIVHLPNSLHARVLSLDEVKKLNASKQLELKKIADQKRKLASEKKKKKLEKKKLEKKRAEKKKKALAKKKADAKRKKEQAKQKTLKIKKQKEKKRLKEKRQAELDKKRKAKQAREKLDKERIEQEAKKKKAAEQKTIREQRLLDQMNAIEAKELEHQSAIENRQQEALLRKQQKAAQVFELTEVERFMSLIRSKIQARWHIPPKTLGLTVSLRIQLLPSGELARVTVLESSGNTSLDQSAQNAVRSVISYPLPSDAGIFDRNFRQFTMRFTPEK